jgi:hypothetical protein
MKNRYSTLTALLALGMALALGGCEQTPTEVEDYQAQPVLSAFLVNGDTLREVHLERVAPLAGYYDPLRHGIVGAAITITGGGVNLVMTDDSLEPGRYVPLEGQYLVPQSLVVYRIEAVTPAPFNESLWAETCVPGRVTEHGPVEIFLEYPDGSRVPVNDGDHLNRNMPNLIWRWNEVDSAAGFQGVALALTPRDLLVPLDPDWTPEDELEDTERNRLGWDHYRADQRQVNILWLAFQWEGPYLVELRALSPSYENYIFSLFRLQQGMISAPVSNIQGGGLGIFGAMSRYSIRVYLERVQP